MSFKFIEGFGAYAPSGSISYTAGEDPTLQWSVWSGSGLQMVAYLSDTPGVRQYTKMTAGTDLTSKVFDATGLTSVVIGARIYNPSGGTANLVMTLMDGASVLGIIGFDTAGKMVYAASDQSLTSPVATATNANSTDSWNYCEWEITFSDTVGVVNFYTNGTANGTNSTLDTINAGTNFDQLILGQNTATHDWQANTRVTDLYIDTATVRGPVEIWYQAANADGSVEQFAPLSGSNYENVDDLGSDGDTSYNASDTPSNQDHIAHSQTIGIDPLAVQPMVHAKLDGAGSADIQVGIYSGTTEDLATAEGLSSDYDGYLGTIYETDPDTAIAWVAADCDAAETVYEHDA